ncbi:MAG TPA: glucose-6-phosphate dehydrogenase assembly protein OpcA [Gaiellaceae bacterium]|nr:glucose-6-phosphate dehydrogenase assembly protein OpcA [Gaiellaceae bacterium]
MASALTDTWNGEDTTVAEIERELARLRRSAVEGDATNMRTSVMTHCVWVPPEWLEPAKDTLSGMGERHPSRTILLVPKPGEPNGLDAEVSVRCFDAGERHICSEVIELGLRGNRTLAPASIVLPLLISDVPVFCRWRGEPAFGEPAWGQLVGVVDRLIVNTSEWETLRFGELAESFDLTAVSDLAWANLHAWRIALARCWPAIREQEIHIRGPLAEATLLHGWLVSRLDRPVAAIKPADELSVQLGGEQLAAPDREPLSASDLLSAELDRLDRDRVYEQAVRAA